MTKTISEMNKMVTKVIESRPLKMVEMRHTVIQHKEAKTKGIIIGTLLGGFKVHVPEENKSLKLPFANIDKWEVITFITPIDDKEYQEPLEILGELIEEKISAALKSLGEAKEFITTYLKHHSDASGLINASSELSLSNISDFLGKYFKPPFFCTIDKILQK